MRMSKTNLYRFGVAAVALVGALFLSSCGRSGIWPAAGTPEGKENCTNGLDDDGDSLVDCKDSDCKGDPACRTSLEICQNGVDDDSDGFVDCQDPDCKGASNCSTTPEICANHRDDDSDGLVDCNDPDCFSDPACKINPEICNNGKDDDSDGLIDCQDPQCFGDPSCRKSELCHNFIDDDSNGLVDCNDPACYLDPGCIKGEICNNKIDDNGNGLIDCEDPQCKNNPLCSIKTEICDNKKDDDGNGLIDCKDPVCFTDPFCTNKKEICDNYVDDDSDTLVDCEDPDCSAFPDCKTKQENCTNNIDDDGDTLVDCKDPDCFKHPSCKIPGQEICNNGLDDDEDTLIDCDDLDCKYLPICVVGKEICDNKKDDDGDGAIDCSDPDCKDFPACIGILCDPTVNFGTLQPKGSASTQVVTTTGTLDVYSSTCGVPGGGEVVAQFHLVDKTDLKLEYKQITGDHVFALFRAGLGEACNANPVSCFDPQSAKTGSFSIKSLEVGTYYLIVEAFAKNLEGEIQVTLSTGPTSGVEICNNGLDDDGDLAIDCADLDCLLTPECATQLCSYDVNLGTLIIDGPPKHTTVNTFGGGNDQEETCAAGGGEDRVIRLVMPGAGGLSVTVAQQGWHVLGMHTDKGPGTKCTADTGSCFDTNQSPSFTLIYDDVEKGVYYYVVEALEPGLEGEVDLTFQAFSNRGPELCANKVDDDGDGLIDCMDPDCVGVVGCPGPVCVADFKTGVLMPDGTPVSFTVDTTIGNNDQTVPCAFGGGKDMVVEIDLSMVSGLMIDCSQTGDHVFGLFAAGQPRDPCDKNIENCADPNLGSLGCGFIMPNLQPGKYYLVVEAFKPGTEGQVWLTLSAAPDHAQEICNNGIDDDGDDKIDCQDSNCASKPICQGASCTPDQKLGILPTGGSLNVAVTTLGAGDSAASSCAKGGGEDVVLGFTLATPANLIIDFAQFGNHVLGLFDNKGNGYACDAAPLSCQTTAGQAMGKVFFTGLAAGEYYLVVEAVASGSEGSVVMKLSPQ
jgi:hypothetical protein